MDGGETKLFRPAQRTALLLLMLIWKVASEGSAAVRWTAYLV